MYVMKFVFIKILESREGDNMNLIKRFYIKIHLKYICKYCPTTKKRTRDIMREGQCWWYENWKKGNYEDIPLWMGIKNFIRLYIFNKPIVICIKGEKYKGYPFKE